ncbi:MAG: site-2 protease family protein [Bacillota bacterium]|nr:site-2 protease family protein [Bacillota bacterium]
MDFLTYIFRIPTVLIALTIHEVSHGYVSYLQGDNTAKNMGRLTLNPIKHLDLWGSIFMLISGFGWAKPVPINPIYYKNLKKGTILTSVAGPLSNIILSVISIFIVKLLSIWYSMVFVSFVCNFLLVFAQLNFFLGIFNLIPIPPLDGGKVLFAALPDKYYDLYLRYEQYGFIILIILVALSVSSSMPISFTGWINQLFQFIFNAILE